MLKHFVFLFVFISSFNSAYALGPGQTVVAQQAAPWLRTPSKEIGNQVRNRGSLRRVSTVQAASDKTIRAASDKTAPTAVEIVPEPHVPEAAILQVAAKPKQKPKQGSLRHASTRQAGSRRATPFSVLHYKRKSKPVPNPDEISVKTLAEQEEAYQSILEKVRLENAAVRKQKKKGMNSTQINLKARRLYRQKVLAEMNEAYRRFLSSPPQHEHVYLVSRKSDAAPILPALHSYIAVAEAPHSLPSAFFSVQQHEGLLKVRDTMQHSDMLDWRKNPVSIVHKVDVHPDYVKRSITEGYEQLNGPGALIPRYDICNSNCNSATHERLSIAMGYQLADYENWLKRKRGWLNARNHFTEGETSKLKAAIEHALEDLTPLPADIKRMLITPRDLAPQIWKMTEPPDPETIKYASTAKGAGSFPYETAKERGIPALVHINPGKGNKNCTGCALATDLTLRGIEAPTVLPDPHVVTELFVYKTGMSETFDNVRYVLNPEVFKHTRELMKPVSGFSELSKKLAQEGKGTTAIISYLPKSNILFGNSRRHMINAKVFLGEDGKLKVLGFDGQKNKKFVLHQKKGASDVVYAVSSSPQR